MVGRKLAPACKFELRGDGVLITFTCASPAARNCQKLIAAEQLLQGRRYGPPSSNFHHDTNYDPPTTAHLQLSSWGRTTVRANTLVFSLIDERCRCCFARYLYLGGNQSSSDAFHGGYIPSRSRVVVSARQATQAGGIDSLGSIPGLLKGLTLTLTSSNYYMSPLSLSACFSH